MMGRSKCRWYSLIGVVCGGYLLIGLLWGQQPEPPGLVPPYATIPETRAGAARSQVRSGGRPSLPAPGNYRIAPNDVLDIRVFHEPDLNTTVRVANDGTIMVPLVGPLRVGGLTVVQAAKEIQGRLAAGYLPNPQVTVNVTQFNRRRFTVLGQVNRSGTYEFPDEGSLTLLQALGLAGGYTSIADPSRVIIRRVVNGKVTVYRVNAKKLATGQSLQEVQIMPGDVITVSESLF